MNIFKFGYYKYRSFWRSIGHNIKQFFRNIKYAYQRCVKGYADCDTWNMDCYLSELIANMLKHLADTTNGWPIKAKSLENWQKLLKVCANNLEFCITSTFDDEKIHEYYKLMESYLSNPPSSKESVQSWVDAINNPVYKDLEKYKESKELWKQALLDGDQAREDAKNVALDFLKEYWFNLWD